ncbi:hypothetical protein OH687_24905 [Burkholderia anthina]|nr:hypothetical protein OH687_24905 [Burkholderia anthina]
MLARGDSARRGACKAGAPAPVRATGRPGMRAPGRSIPVDFRQSPKEAG